MGRQSAQLNKYGQGFPEDSATPKKAAGATGGRARQKTRLTKKHTKPLANTNNSQSASPASSLNADAKRAQPQLDSLARRTELFVALGLVIGIAALYLFGRTYWDERYYTSDEGLGYYLGLVGGSMMLLAVGYTLFKYVALFRTRAVMKYWLTIHIFFGVMGPVLVLIHSTFRIGSLNGGIALVTMLLVFLSGVMGRFLYSKTHYGLGGKKARAKDLQEIIRLAGYKINSERLNKFTLSVMTHKDSFLGALWELMSFGWRSRRLRYTLTQDMQRMLVQLSAKHGWSRGVTRQKKRAFKRQIRSYVIVLEKVALFHVYERFFSFWRNAHVPLIYLLLMSGIVHVVAVHMY